jgi:hypothetical protein
MSGRREIAVLVLLCTVANAEGYAQSPMSIRNIGGDAPNVRVLGASSANNPWFGSQVVHRFGQSDDFASNLLVSGQIVYPINLGKSKLKLPVVGNISGAFAEAGNQTTKEATEDKLSKILQSGTGATLGVFPYRAFDLAPAVLVTVHGQASWKGNVLKTKSDSTRTEMVSQGKFGFGAELLLGKRDDNSSLFSISITPMWLAFSKDQLSRVVGVEKSPVRSIETVVVVPIRTGVGVLFESVVATSAKPALRMGVIIAKEN